MDAVNGRPALCRHWANMAEASGRAKRERSQRSQRSQRKPACHPREPLVFHSSCFALRADHSEHDCDDCEPPVVPPVVAYFSVPWRQESPLMDGPSQWSADPQRHQSMARKGRVTNVSYMTQAAGSPCLMDWMSCNTRLTDLQPMRLWTMLVPGPPKAFKAWRSDTAATHRGLEAVHGSATAVHAR